MARTTDIASLIAEDEPDPRFWRGMIAFAALLLTLEGGFHVLGGFIALLEGADSYEGDPTLMIPISANAYGIIHMVLGVVMMLAAYALFWGRTWGRAFAVVVAFIGALTNLASLSTAPGRYALLIVLDILVILAVTVHGDSAKEY